MFARSFRRFFAAKTNTIVNAKKAPIGAKARKKGGLSLELLEDRVVPSNFASGNLAVLEAANTTSDTTGSILELSPTTANQSSPVQTVPLNNVYISGGAGTVGYLADSDNGTLLTLAGYQPVSSSPSNVNVIPQRYAVAYDYTTAQTLAEEYQDPGAATNTNTARSAATFDGNTYFNGDQGGLYSNNESANAGTYTTALEAVKPFGSTMFSGSKSTPGAVEIIPNATSTSLTALTGIGADASFADFYITNPGTSEYDMYILDASGTINKYSATSLTGTWTAEGSATGGTANGDDGVNAGDRMAAQPDGSGGNYLYVTDGGAGIANNNLIELDDTAAWNGSISINSANNTLLYTAPGTGANATTLYGVAFVPTSSSSVLTSAAVPTYTTGTINFGASATFSDVVTALEGSTSPPAGSVAFYSSTGTLLATATSITGNGSNPPTSTFSVTSTTVPVGTWTGVVAVYDPSGYSASASLPGSGTLTVNGITTTTAVPTFTPTTVQVGQSVTYTAVVTASSGSTAPTAGTVTFESGSTILATASSESTSGTNATFTVTASTSSLGVGTFNNITAVYSGNGNFDGSTSNASSVSLTVTAIPLPAGTIAQWTFENDTIATNNGPAPDIGVGTADSIGMTNTVNISSITESGTTATVTLATPLFGVTSGSLKLLLAGNSNTAGNQDYNGQVTATVTGTSSFTFTAAHSGDGSATTVGTATGYGTPNVGVTTDDVAQGATGDTGANGLADLSHIWRVRAQAGSNGAANGWSSFAPIGTQGAQFFTSTAGDTGAINISFDWYATSAGEANLQLEYTTNGGTTWTNVPVTVPTADADISALTNGSSSNTVTGSYVHISNAASPGPQEWAQGLTATINDPNADNDAGFGIEMVNASQGADDVNAGGTALNNTSGNWRFDNVDIAVPQLYTPGNVVLLQVGAGNATYTQAPISLDEVNPNATNQVPISGTTADALGNVTVTTTGTQTFTAGQWVQISGVQVGSTVSNAYNGFYNILTVNNAGNTFTYFNQLAGGLAAGTPATNGAWASNVVQQDAIPSTTGTGTTGISAVSGTGTATATVTTSTTALYAVGESLTFSGITPSAWDNTFTVASVISPTQFTITQNLPAITSPLASAVITPPNQPLTISLNQPISVGQLNRSYDGSSLTLAGIDSGTDPSNTTVLPISTDGRDLAVVTGNPNIPSDINTSTYGAWNGGDDTRTAIAETAYGPIYEVGHNQDVSGFPAYVGVHEFPTEGSGPTLGTQVSASTNIRAVTIGPDNREYFVTATGISSVGTAAGVYTDAAALPASNSATPSADIMVVPNFVTNAKLNGAYIADMNGTGVISNGDRLYYINGDTATGAGGAGLFVATWNTSNDYPWDTPNNAGAQAAGILDYWGLPVRLGDAPVQTGSTSVGTLIGVAGTVLSLNNGNTPGTVELYTNAHDTTAGDDSIIQQWMDSGSGVTITSAQVSGNTVTITTASPINFINNEYVTIDGIGNGGGSSWSVSGATVQLITAGDNGTFRVTVTGTNTFTYTDNNSNLVSLTNAGGVGSADAAVTSDLSQANTYTNFGIGINGSDSDNNNLAETFGGTIVQTLAGGIDGSLASKPQVTIGGIAFTPVAPTTVTLADSSGTLTATLTNSQVTPSGQVAFINENTGAVLGFGTISGSAPYTATLPDSTVVGDAYVEAYFAGGGTLALAPAQSNIIQVNNAGSTTDSVTVSPSLPAVAVNTPVTLTATVTPSSGPTGNVSFYNTTGGVQPSLANLIGTVALTGNTAALTAAFANTGTQTITAVYNGDATYESNFGTTTVTVALNATAAITPSANNVVLNSTPTYTVNLTGNATLGAPLGTVTVTIVSATNNTTGHPVISQTSSSLNLTGSGNNSSATWSSAPELTTPGSYIVTMTYTPANGSGYSGFSINAESSGANYTNTALIENVNQAFTPGNLVLVQRGDGTLQTGSSGGLVELDEYSPAGVEVQSIVLPNTSGAAGTNQAFVSGSQNAALGLLNRSVNGAYLTLIGYDTELGTQFLTSSFPYTIPRTIAEVGSGAAGAVNTTTAISSTSPTSVPYEQEDAVSYDGNQFWIVSALPPGDITESGVEYVSSLGATSATQLTGAGTTGAAINIAGGQLYVTGGSGNINAVGAGLPSTSPQTLTGLPNLQNQYQNYFTSNRNPEQVLLLNTTNGTTYNPNVAYVADQDYGLLKFSLNNVTLSLSSSGTTATATVTSGSLYFLSNGSDQVQITGAPGYNGIYTLPAAAISGQSFTFTLPNGGSGLASTTGTGGQWLLGQYGTGVFGQKLVFAGGATGVTGNISSTGPIGGYTAQLYVTGANVQGLNPNEYVSLADNSTNPGLPSGSFSLLAVDGASGSNGGTSNANANFAGIAFVPGATTTTTVTSSAATTTYGKNVTFTATITAGTGGVTPTGTVSFYDGITLLGTSAISTVSGHQVATFTTTNYLSLGKHTISAVFNPGGQALANDDVSTGKFTQGIVYDPPAVDLVTTQVGFNSPIASVSVNGSTVTVTTSEFLPFALNATGLNMTIAGNSGTNINGTYPITLLSQTSFSYTAGLGTPTAGSSGTVSLGLASVGVTATSVATVGGVTTVTVTTSASSGFSSGQMVTIAGTAGGTNINGNFILTSASGTTLKYISPGAVAATTFTGATADSSAPLTSSATATYLNDSTVFPIATTGTPVSVSGSGAATMVTVTTTASSTDFVVGEEVTVAGTTGGTNINGTFAITAVSGSTFTYSSPNAVAPSSTTNSTATGWNANNTVYLPTAVSAATINAASWNISTDLVTVTTSAAHNIQAGQLVTITSNPASNYDGSYVVLSVPTSTTFTYGLLSDPGTYTSTGTAQVDQAALTEGGTATTSGYITNSLDGNSLELVGNDAAPGASLGATTLGVVATVDAYGDVNDSTLLPGAVGTTRAVASPDGSGFWVTTSSNSVGGLVWVPFGGSTPSAISAASWASTNGGTATITAPNSYVSGQKVSVVGIGTATGYNGTFTILTASTTQFTYFLATQPTGTPTYTGATSQLLPTQISLEANNQNNSNQTPSTVTIGTDQNYSPNQLLVDAGNQFQTNGVPSIDGPFEVGSNLPTTGGQPISVYGNGQGQNFPNSTDRFGGFPTSAQFAVSPDGQTIFVADSRTDSFGGILEYYQALPGQWDLLGELQLDNFNITSATESGTTVTITTSAPTDFFVGQSVAVDGVQLGAYDGSGFTVTSVSGNTFTYTASFTNLTPSGPGTFGAFATGADGGFRGLVADWTDGGTNDGGVILYATTSGTSGNRVVEITGGTGSSENNNGYTPTFAYTLLATAAPNAAVRGVAFAPAVPGATASTTSLTASGNTLTATVTSGATGWVSFFQANGSYIGTAYDNSGTATLNTTGTLPAGSYNVYAVYTGDSTYASSTSSQVSDTVNPISTSTRLTFSPSPVGTNQADTLTATISGGSGLAPTGLVTFTNTTSSTTLGYGTVSQVIQNVNGQPVVTFVATLTVPAGTFTAGTYSIQAAYSGDGYFGSSSDSESLSVVNSTVTTVTSSAANPTGSSNGTALTLTATVTSAAGTPGGTVQFYDDTLPLGTPVTVNGSGVATLPVEATLVQSVTVLSAAESTSGSTTTVTITTNAANPMFVGEEVVVEGLGAAYDSTSPDGALPNPSQFFTVTAVSGNTFSYVDANANGAATVTGGGLAIGLNVLTPGMHSISAVYTPTGSSLTSFAASTGVHEQTVQGQAFGTSDAYQERNGDGITSLNSRAPNPTLGSIGVTIYVDELTPSGTLVQSFALPTADSEVFSISSSSWSSGTETITTTSPTDYAVGTVVTINPNAASGYTATVSITGVGTNSFSYAAASNPGTISGTVQGVVHAVVGDGQQSTTSQMTLSGDGQYLFVDGYDNNPLPYGTANSVPTGSSSSNVPRSIARIDSSGNAVTEAFTLGATGIDSGTGLLNGVYSPDGNQFYLSAATGIYYFPSVQVSATLQGSSPADLLDAPGTSDGLESYNGNLYVIGAGGSGGTSNFVEQQLPKATDVVITNIAWASSVATVTANNSFSAGQDVTIAGVTGATGYNGTWAIASANSTSFTFNLATQPSGTPAYGSSTASYQPLTGMPSADVQTITNATWASSVATITANNDFAVGERVLVSGITTATGYNGTFTITSIITSSGQQTGFTYALTTQPTGTPGFSGATASLQSAQLQVAGIPINSTSEPVPVFFGVDAYFTHTNGGGSSLDTIYIADDGKSFGGGDITKWSLTSVSISSITQSGTTATVNLGSSALNLAASIAENITISGETGAAAGYNGTWAITQLSATSFKFTAPANLTGDSSPAGSASGFTESGAVLYSEAIQQLGFYWLAGTTNPSTHAVTLYTTYGNGGNGDFGPGITYAFTDTNGFNNAPGVPITNASWASGTATITAANNFQAGQYVNVTGITTATGYNGLYTIVSANATSFTYALASQPSGTPGFSGAYAVSLDTVDTVAFEGFGKYVGNETDRGVALAPQAMTDVLVDNGPNPATTGQSFTLTDTLTSPGSIYVPTGTLTLEYFNGTSDVVVPTTGGTLSNGSATLTVAAGVLSTGTYNLFTVYSGDTYHQSTTSNTVSQVVNSTSTTTLVDNGEAADPATAGGSVEQSYPVSFTVTVSASSGTPTGTVQLEDAANSDALVGSAQTLVNGTVTFSVAATAGNNFGTGTHQLIAVYTPTGNFTTSTSGQVAQVIDPVFKVQTIGTSTTSNYTQTATGDKVVLNAPVNTSDFNLFTPAGSSGAAAARPGQITAGLFDYVSVTSATESGTTVTLTVNTANAFANKSVVIIDGVGPGYDGEYIVTTVSGNNKEYTYTAFVNNLSEVDNQGEVGTSVNGSLVQLSSAQYQFVATGTDVSPTDQIPLAGALTPGGQYAVFLAGSGAAAMQDTDGNSLAGTGTTTGTSFFGPFTVPSSATDLVSVPYAARVFGTNIGIPDANPGVSVTATESGFEVTATTASALPLSVGQSVNITGLTPSGYDGTFVVTSVSGDTLTYTDSAANLAHSSGSGTAVLAGLPVSIDVTTSTAVTSAQFDVVYNPLVLSIPAGAPGSITIPGFTGGSVSLTSPGVVHVDLGSATGSGLAVGNTYDVVSLNATVLPSAALKAKEVLDVQNININGAGAGTGRDGSAVHVVASPGDVVGTVTGYNGQDGAAIGSLLVGSLYGYTAYKDLDPKIITDVTNAGSLSGQDGAAVGAAATGKSSGYVNIPSATITAVSYSGSGTTLTATTSNAVLFAVGELVNISGLSVGADNGNGFVVTSVNIAGTSFTYTDTNSGIASTSGTQAGLAVISAASTGGPDPVLYIGNITGTPGSTVVVPVNMLITDTTDTSTISDIKESGTTVTVTTSAANDYTNGETIGIGGVVVNNYVQDAYNGSFTITRVDSTHFTYTDTTTGLPEVSGGTGTAGVPGSITYQSDDMGIGFDPNVLQVSNVTGGNVDGPSSSASITESGTTATVTTTTALGVSANQMVDLEGFAVTGYDGLFTVNSVSGNSFTITAASGLGSASGGTAAINYGNSNNITTSSNPDNGAGTIRIDQFINNGNFPTLPFGSFSSVVLISFTISSSASPGTTVVNLEHNVSTSTTEVNGGAAPLNPAPTNGASDPVDGTLTIVGPSATLSVGNASTNPGGTITVPVTLTAGPGGFTYDSDDMGIRFDPSVLQVTSISGPSAYPSPADNLLNSGNVTTSSNFDNGAGTIRIDQFENNGNFPAIPPNVGGTILSITFSVLSNAPFGSSVIDLAHNVSTSTTEVNGGAVPLSPAPTTDSAAFNDPSDDPDVADGVDGVVAVSPLPNIFPKETVPTTALTTLFNPAAVPGLQTATPNTVAFSGGISIDDPNEDNGIPGVSDTTVLTLNGTPAGTSTGAVGVLSIPAGSIANDVTVNGNNTAQLSLTSMSQTDLNTALAALSYMPGAGFYGAANLDVDTTNTVPGATPTSLSTDKSTSVTVVGLFLSEIMLNPAIQSVTLGTSGITESGTTATVHLSANDGFTAGQEVVISGASVSGYNNIFTIVGVTNSGSTHTFTFTATSGLGTSNGGTVTNGPGENQYIELFSSVPNYPIPTNVYLVGVNGDKNSTGVAPGVVQDVFTFHNGSSQLSTGGNGYLLLDEKGQPYTNAGVVNPNGNAFNNTSTTGSGFGNGGTTSTFNGISGIHTGATRTGRSESPNDLEQGSASYLLIETSTAPTTSSNIDSAGTGTPNGSTYAGWNVLDGVAILRNSNGSGGPDRSYAPITFKASANTTGTTISGTTLVSTGAWTATYVGRIGINTGESTADWLASVPTTGDGTTSLDGTYILDTTKSTQFPGQSLNNLAAPNYWAPEETVQVNDGSSNQHSQVTELTVTFNEPVNIANLQGDFVVEDASGNVIATIVTVTNGTDNGDGTASNVLALVITFNTDTSSDTYAFAGSDPFGNTRGLVDGNYFLDSIVADITNNGVALDGAHNGVGGSTTSSSRGGVYDGHGVNEVDEFWRLFGDSLGRRRVDNTDVNNYQHAAANGGYAWYFDYNMDGVLDSTDLAALLANRFKQLQA